MVAGTRFCFVAATGALRLICEVALVTAGFFLMAVLAAAGVATMTGLGFLAVVEGAAGFFSFAGAFLLVAGIFFTGFGEAFAAILACTAAIRNSSFLPFLTAGAIQLGAFPCPVQVFPVFGSMYFGTDAGFFVAVGLLFLRGEIVLLGFATTSGVDATGRSDELEGKRSSGVKAY